MSEYRISNVPSQREEQVKYRVEKRAAADSGGARRRCERGDKL